MTVRELMLILQECDDQAQVVVFVARPQSLRTVCNEIEKLDTKHAETVFIEILQP